MNSKLEKIFLEIPKARKINPAEMKKLISEVQKKQEIILSQKFVSLKELELEINL